MLVPAEYEDPSSNSIWKTKIKINKKRKNLINKFIYQKYNRFLRISKNSLYFMKVE